MKILVISRNEVKNIFSSPSKHELEFSSVEDALINFLADPPNVVFFFIDENFYFKEQRTALNDIKYYNKGSQIFRIGFSSLEDSKGETHLSLPILLTDEKIEKILS